MKRAKKPVDVKRRPDLWPAEFPEELQLADVPYVRFPDNYDFFGAQQKGFPKWPSLEFRNAVRLAHFRRLMAKFNKQSAIDAGREHALKELPERRLWLLRNALEQIAALEGEAATIAQEALVLDNKKAAMIEEMKKHA